MGVKEREGVKGEVGKGDVCGVMIEGMEGVGGIEVGSRELMKGIGEGCEERNRVMIVDEMEWG